MSSGFATEALADQRARARIERDLDATLFVEAGAGTGKTTTLVSRILELVRSGVELSHVAAITFTESAAGELRSRVQRALETALERETADPHLERALHAIDDAAMTTIHAFAQRLLVEHPLEAGLPLQVRVMDEISSALELAQRVDSLIDRLASDDEGGRLLVACKVLDIGIDAVRELARLFDERWDLWIARATQPAAPGDLRAIVEEEVASFEAAIEDLLGFAEHCQDPSDGLFQLLAQVAERPAPRAAHEDWLVRLEWLVTRATRTASKGKRDNWTGCDVDDARAAVAAYRAAGERAEARVVDAVLSRLGTILAEDATTAARARRHRGELRYHDLLVLARDLLESSDAVRDEVAARYERVLVDEFQDTDPVQFELVRLLGRSSASSSGLDAGRLFFVGDPKQSIYRFRGADVARYTSALEEVAPGGPERLVANFRSVPGVLAWVNTVFGEAARAVMIDGAFAEEAELRPARPPLGGGGPPVVVLGGALEGLRATERRQLESADVASLIRSAVGTWLVEDDVGQHRPARYGDMAILVPTRNGLEELKAALATCDVPHRLSSATLVYGATEVRELLACWRALAAPSDAPAVIAALRSCYLGCADDELLEFRSAGGQWRLDAPVPPGLSAEHRVVQGLAVLGALEAVSRREGPLEAIERLVECLPVLEIAASDPRGLARVRHIRFVLDQARTFFASGRTSLLELLEWMDLQAEERVRSSEPLPVEADNDEVAVMTVHAAKGLEFKIAIVCELGGVERGAVSGPMLLSSGDGGFELQVRKARRSAGFASLSSAEDDRQREERLRLCYVALTRARDHLVVALHHDPSQRSLARQLFEADQEHLELAVHEAALTTPGTAAASSSEESSAPSSSVRPATSVTTPPGPASTPARLEAFDAAHESLLARAKRPRVLSGSMLEVPSSSAPVGDRRGGGSGARAPSAQAMTSFAQSRRAKSALGRAVHRVLATVELATRSGIAELCQRRAVDEGCAEAAVLVHALVEAALDSPVLVAAAKAERCWRELPFAVELRPHHERTGPGLVLEGVVDLCFEHEGALVLVDYKTDPLGSDSSAETLATRTRPQLGAYARGLSALSGRRVAQAVVLVLTEESGAIEVDLGSPERLASQAEALMLGLSSPL